MSMHNVPVINGRFSQDIAKRLGELNLQVDPLTGCWVITNYSCKSNGYPRWRSIYDRRMTPIAREIWELIHDQPIPNDKVVVRTCGNKECAKPDHLNLRDRKITQEMMIERRKAELQVKKRR